MPLSTRDLNSANIGHQATFASSLGFTTEFQYPSRRLIAGIALLWLAIATVALWRGPAMGDHEVIVAQTARQSIETGKWIVPHYLDTPFLVKPPMPAWLVGAVTEIADSAGSWFGRPVPGDPVNVITARLPSVIATIITILILFRLGTSMYDRRTGFMAAFIYACSIGAMLYAFNATAEALLTLFSTWAFAQFWWAHTAATTGRRRLHMFFFYVAFGLAMLAKGPMPLMLVATPIAVWWWCNRPARLLAAGGIRSGGAVVKLGVLDSLPRLGKALSSLGLWWGVPVFLAMFLPWMFMVASREAYAWKLWNYEYLDRLLGDYPGCETGQYYYYLPIIMGLTVPWMLSFPEALAAPFLQKYRRDRKPLFFAWFWVIIGAGIMSMMSFKKPYYIVPVLPGCALLLAPVLRDFFFRVSKASKQLTRNTYIAIVVVWAIVTAIVWTAMRYVASEKYHEIWSADVQFYSLIFVLFTSIGVVWVGLLYLCGRRFYSFVSLGVIALAAFGLVWSTIGAKLDNLEDPLELVQKLRKNEIPREADIYWAGNRPDGRVVFYGNQPIRQIVDPYRLVSEQKEIHNNESLIEYVGSEIVSLLKGNRQIYLVLQRKQMNTIRLYYGSGTPMQEMFDVDRGIIGPDEDDWVVVTNVRRTAMAPAR